MAYITKQELAPFLKTGIIEHRDYAELARISRELKLKREETGFSSVQMKNFTIEGHTCSERTKTAILDYFNKKMLSKKKEFDKVFK